MKHSFIQSGFFSSLLNRATQVISGDVTVLLDKICYLSFFNHNLSDLHVCNTKPQRKRWEKVCIFRSFSGRFHRKHTTHRTVVPRFPESHPITQLEWQWNGSLAWLLAYDINSNVVYFYDCVRIIFASHQPVHVHGMISRLSVYKTDQNAAVVLFCVLY